MDGEVRRDKDGRTWLIGSTRDVSWIERRTTSTRGITGAVPTGYEAYATVRLPVTPNDNGGWTSDEPPDRRDAHLLAVLRDHTAPQPWWLGYLETGLAAETVFYDVPSASLYGWGYVLVQAGPDQAGSWRASWGRKKGVLPDLMFPADRSWLASTLWDDYWMSVGGSRELIAALLAESGLRALADEVDPAAPDATPPRAADA